MHLDFGMLYLIKGGWWADIHRPMNLVCSGTPLICSALRQNLFVSPLTAYYFRSKIFMRDDRTSFVRHGQIARQRKICTPWTASFLRLFERLIMYIKSGGILSPWIASFLRLFVWFKRLNILRAFNKRKKTHRMRQNLLLYWFHRHYTHYYI